MSEDLEGLPELPSGSRDEQAVPATAALAGWQPIETVPEGEHVLLWFPKGEKGNGGMECARLYRESDGGLPPGGWTHGGPNSGSDWDWGYDDMPTHWMPLPAPPAAPRQPAEAKAAGEYCSWCSEAILPGQPTGTSDGERMHIGCAAEDMDNATFDRDFGG